MRVFSFFFTYLFGSGIDPFLRVPIRDPAADLQTARPRSQGFPRRLRVPWPEHDDMGASEVIFPVEVCEVRGRMRGHEIRLEGGRRLLVERPADDLFDLACVQVYARTEERHTCVPQGK